MTRTRRRAPLDDNAWVFLTVLLLLLGSGNIPSARSFLAIRSTPNTNNRIGAVGQGHERCWRPITATSSSSWHRASQKDDVETEVQSTQQEIQPQAVSTTRSKRVTQVGKSSSDDNNTVLEENCNNNREDSEQQQTSFVNKMRNAKFLERNKHWVVLVDDEEAIRLAVGDYLYDQGYQVTACADADAFLDICQRGLADAGDGSAAAAAESENAKSGSMPIRVPDLIVSDVRMPGKNGLELLSLIRADHRLSRVPVILLTAKGLAADRVAGYKAGANVYLPKPFEPQELLSIIDNSIQRRKQMTSQKGSLVDLKQEMNSIKEIMKRNAETVVQKTNVYLTLVEREVLEMICKGYTNQEIATERGVKVMGVTRVIQKLYDVTKTETRTELVRWAYKTGYVSKR